MPDGTQNTHSISNNLLERGYWHPNPDLETETHFQSSDCEYLQGARQSDQRSLRGVARGNLKSSLASLGTRLRSVPPQ